MGYMDSMRKIREADYSKCSDSERDQVARDVVDICAFACAGLVLQPIPGLEQSVLPIQIMMILTIAHIYGKEINRKKAHEILMDLARITGASLITRQVLTSVAKFVLPGLGGILAAPATFSLTWATGYASIYYLRSGGKVDEERIRKIFEEEKSRSKSFYSDDRAKANRPKDDDVKGM